MPTFSTLDAWDMDDKGNVKLRLGCPDGKVYDANFDRSIIPALLVVLNRFLMGSVEKFPEGARDLLVAQLPISTEVLSRPDGGYALAVNAQSGTAHHFPVDACTLVMFSQAIAELSSLLAAEAEPHKH